MSRAHNEREDTRFTVLVVDDDDIIRMSIADYLRDSGLDVLEAASGEAGQAAFEAGAPIDVVFSDVQMSPHLDGIALANWVHANHPNVPVMLTSGVTILSSLPEAICPQGSVFIKPYEFTAVAARIQALLSATQLDDRR